MKHSWECVPNLCIFIATSWRALQGTGWLLSSSECCGQTALSGQSLQGGLSCKELPGWLDTSPQNSPHQETFPWRCMKPWPALDNSERVILVPELHTESAEAITQSASQPDPPSADPASSPRGQCAGLSQINILQAQLLHRACLWETQPQPITQTVCTRPSVTLLITSQV